MSKTSSSPSPATWTIFISILTLVLLVIQVFDNGKFSFEDGEYEQIAYIVGIALFLAMLANWKRVNNQIERIKSRIKFLFDIVVEYRRGHLEFLDKYGEKAMYNQECLFKRIRRNVNYESVIESDGEIDNEIHTYNCYNTLNHSKNKVTFVYGKKKKNKDLLNNKRQLQFGYVITQLNSYPGKREYWGTRFSHYTKSYDLKISFHIDNPPRDVGLFNVTKELGKEKLAPIDVDPLIMQKYGRVVMKIKLLHVNKGDLFRVCWTWDKPKKKKPSK